MCIYGNCALWGCLFWSHILEEIGILKGDQKGVKDWMTLTVTHWLLHHHVTVEFQGSMGKFVQLSTQIGTYRNCRGRWERGALYVCVCVHAHVVFEVHMLLRTDRTLETCIKKKGKKREKQYLTVAPVLGEYLGLKEKLLPAYCTGLSWFLLLNRPCLDLNPFILCQSFCRVGHQTQLLS